MSVPLVPASDHAEVVCLNSEGAAQFDLLHSRFHDHDTVATAFDLLMVDGDDIRRKPFIERKAALRKLIRDDRRGIQYVEHAEGHGDAMYDAVCRMGLEGIVSKRIDAPYRSGHARSWIKVKNPNAPAATRAQDGTF